MSPNSGAIHFSQIKSMEELEALIAEIQHDDPKLTSPNWVGPSSDPSSLRAKFPSYTLFFVGRWRTASGPLVVIGGTEWVEDHRMWHINKRCWVAPKARANLWPIASLIRAQILTMDEMGISTEWVCVSFHGRQEALAGALTSKNRGLGTQWPSIHNHFEDAGWQTVNHVRQRVAVAETSKLRGS